MLKKNEGFVGGLQALSKGAGEAAAAVVIKATVTVVSVVGEATALGRCHCDGDGPSGSGVEKMGPTRTAERFLKKVLSPTMCTNGRRRGRRRSGSSWYWGSLCIWSLVLVLAAQASPGAQGATPALKDPAWSRFDEDVNATLPADVLPVGPDHTFGSDLEAESFDAKATALVEAATAATTRDTGGGGGNSDDDGGGGSGGVDRGSVRGALAAAMEVANVTEAMDAVRENSSRRLRRAKRYVRFPPATAPGRQMFPPRMPGPSYTVSWAPFSPSPVYLYSSPPPGRRPPPHPPVPAMGHRSPRLVFRDPTDPSGPGTGAFFPGPTLQDISIEDPRGCGVSTAKLAPTLGAQRRIVGGDEAGFGSFPWQAYIRIGSSRCGGSLVSRRHVVTAGHCVARARAAQIRVTLGDYVLNSDAEPLPAYTFGVRDVRVHPLFRFTPQADRYDVAVLRLDRPAAPQPHIAPICLPARGEPALGRIGWAAGWGALQPGSRLRPKTLQAVDVPVIDSRQCERWHKANGINVVIYEEMLCAGYRGGGKDSCQGDSGGPLMTEKAGRWYLIGIVSAGYSCAQRGQPGIYHRVAHTVDWISYIINS